MDYKVSALKYRPNEFSKVIGQNHVTDTLKNSIKENKIPSAILFCGPKGVGKTTCARIYAREINKEFIQLENYDYAFNIFELDAASNRKIDDIRDLLEKVKIPPQVGKYKVYIIDEVHMLTKEAENAFLKTLEEPPPHIVFILATTEKNKILPTILSRCQIYDFNKISDLENKYYLEEIIKSEGYNYESKAVSIIAKKAYGSLRDSLTILDRVINYTNGNITLEKTSQILNILDTDTYIELSDFILKAELNNAILGFNEISDKGFGEKDFLEGLVEHFRNLIVVKASNTQSLIDDENNFEKVIEQSKLAEQNKLINAIEILEGSIINLSKFENKKLVVEISLMKICKMSESSNISEKKKVENTNSIPTINPEKNSFKQNSIDEEKFQKSELLKKSSAENVKKVENISALSLSSLKLKKQAREEKDLIESEKKKSSDIFNLNSLRDKIKKYSKKINDLGKKSLSSLLEMNEPTLEENSITFTLPSKISLIEFEKEREAFTIFLQKELNNYNIKVLSKIEEKKNGDYFSSPTEKLTKLIEINPLVGKFKEDLKLDL
jgi:DNA polymerase-3 subunit gamma/tau